MHGHFRALVVGHGLAQVLRDAAQTTPEAVDDVLRGIAFEFDQHDVAAQAFDQCANRRAIHRARDQVAFPVPGHDPGCHLWRAQRDGDHIGQACLAFGAAGPQQPRLVALAQQLDQFGAQRAPDVRTGPS